MDGDRFGKIVSEPHFRRLRALLERTKGKVVMGGKVDEARRKIQLTVVVDVEEDDALLEGYVYDYFMLNDANRDGAAVQRDLRTDSTHHDS